MGKKRKFDKQEFENVVGFLVSQLSDLEVSDKFMQELEEIREKYIAVWNELIDKSNEQYPDYYKKKAPEIIAQNLGSVELTLADFELSKEEKYYFTDLGHEKIACYTNLRDAIRELLKKHMYELFVELNKSPERTMQALKGVAASDKSLLTQTINQLVGEGYYDYSQKYATRPEHGVDLQVTEEELVLMLELDHLAYVFVNEDLPTPRDIERLNAGLKMLQKLQAKAGEKRLNVVKTVALHGAFAVANKALMKLYYKLWATSKTIKFAKSVVAGEKGEDFILDKTGLNPHDLLEAQDAIKERIDGMREITFEEIAKVLGEFDALGIPNITPMSDWKNMFNKPIYN